MRRSLWLLVHSLLTVRCLTGIRAVDQRCLKNFLSDVLSQWLKDGPLNFAYQAGSDEGGNQLLLSVLRGNWKHDNDWMVSTLTHRIPEWTRESSRTVILWPLAPGSEWRQFPMGMESLMTKGTWLVPHDLIRDDTDIVLRFDSGVFLYNLTCGGAARAKLSEVFSIKGKLRITNGIGWWIYERKQGRLNIFTPNVWERRQRFLEGVKLKGVYLPFPPFGYVKRVDGRNVTYGILKDAIKLLQVVLF